MRTLRIDFILCRLYAIRGFRESLEYTERDETMEQELTCTQAAKVLGVTPRTIQNRINDGRLIARRQGLQNQAFIAVDALRFFAAAYGYRINEHWLERYLGMHG